MKLSSFVAYLILILMTLGQAILFCPFLPVCLYVCLSVVKVSNILTLNLTFVLKIVFGLRCGWGGGGGSVSQTHLASLKTRDFFFSDISCHT